MLDVLWPLLKLVVLILFELVWSRLIWTELLCTGEMVLFYLVYTALVCFAKFVESVSGWVCWVLCGLLFCQLGYFVSRVLAIKMLY